MFDDEYVTVSAGFFQTLKCFLVKLNLEYERRRFFYSEDRSVLNIYFSEKFFEEKQNLYFVSKKPNRIDLSPMIKLDSRQSSSVVYKVRQELFEIQLNDKLNFLKNPRSAFCESTSWKDVAYNRRLIRGFMSKYRWGHYLLLSTVLFIFLLSLSLPGTWPATCS